MQNIMSSKNTFLIFYSDMSQNIPIYFTTNYDITNLNFFKYLHQLSNFAIIHIEIFSNQKAITLRSCLKKSI